MTGVWIGNDNSAPMKKATGGGLPARIFHSFMEEAERDMPSKPLPGAEPLPQPDALAPLVAEATQTPAPVEAPAPQPPSPVAAAAQPDSFDKILNNLFGGK